MAGCLTMLLFVSLYMAICSNLHLVGFRIYLAFLHYINNGFLYSTERESVFHGSFDAHAPEHL
jgi:hypothetical protein